MSETFFERLFKSLGPKDREKATEANRWICVQLDKLDTRITRLEQAAKRGADE